MWFKIQNQHIELRIIAKPNAKCSKLLNITEEGLYIALHAKPHQGEANKELIFYLSKLLRVPKSQIILQKGEGSRYKFVLLPLTDTVNQFLTNPTDFIAKK
jgi:uncharacterized protein YggU (UPF0235/DUF167 family)